MAPKLVAGVIQMEDSTKIRSTDEQSAVRYSSLRDYLRVIRRHRLIIVAVTLLLGGAAFAYSANQEKVYESSTALSFRDPLADIDLISEGAAPEEAPQTRAAINAETITNPRVVAAASRELDAELSRAQLAGAVSAVVSSRTNLVVVTARAGDPQLAANIANAFARAAKAVGDQQNLNGLKSAERVLEDQVKDARKDVGEDDGLSTFQFASLVTQLSRVQTLARIAEPVKITSSAVPAGAPVSPKPVRNTVLGLFAGLIVGLVAAFVRDSLDRRFRTAHEVHEELGMPVLARIPDSAMGYPGLASAPDRKKKVSDAEFEPFRVLRTNLAYLSSEGRVRSILVTSGLPEEGKSTVSMALASAAAVAGQQVLLVECDFRRPVFSRRLGIEGEPGLADYLREEAGPAEIVSTVELHPPSSANGSRPEVNNIDAPLLACIPAGRDSGGAVELLDSDRFQGFLGVVSTAYDLVVIDSSPLLAVVDPLRVLPHVDALLLCVRVMRSNRDEAHAVRSALKNLPKRPTGAVVTGLGRGGPDAYEYYDGY